MCSKHLLLTIIGLLSFPDCNFAAPQEANEGRKSLWQRSTLSGDLGGIRSKLAGHGFHLEGNYSGDIFANLGGGRDEDTEYLDNIELKLLMDMEKIAGWRGSRILIYGLRNNGGSISNDAGDVQGVSSIEAASSFKLNEAWIQQNILSNRFSVLAGLYDINSEFDVIQSAGLFINSSHGMGAEFAASGLLGPPTFPLTALGFRLKYQINPAFYFQAVIADGVPGDPNNPNNYTIRIRKEEGAFLAGELSWYRFDSGSSKAGQTGVETRNSRKHIGREVAADYIIKLALGVWGYTSNFENIRRETSAMSNTTARDKGIYALLDWNIYREPPEKNQGLSVFLRVGLADNDASRFNFYGGTGLVYKGLLPGRDQDQIGLALAIARNSDFIELKRTEQLDDAETALEFTYRTQFTPWLAFQPDIQYVINPGTRTDFQNTFVLGARFEMNL